MLHAAVFALCWSRVESWGEVFPSENAQKSRHFLLECLSCSNLLKTEFHSAKNSNLVSLGMRVLGQK